MADFLNELRTNYGAFALAMHCDWTYTHFQQQILAPALEAIAARDPEYSRTMITIPFRHSKSEFCVETFVPFYLGHNPMGRVILVTYGQDQALKSGRAIRELMKQEIYLTLFPHCRLAPHSRAAGEFETLAGGRFYAGAFLTGVNGRGANLLIIDDPHKNRQEVQSEPVMTVIRDTYNSVLRTRLEPHAAILMTTTRWMPGDLVGLRIQEDKAIDHFTGQPFTDTMRAAA